MKLNGLVPILKCTDIDQCLSFYKETLRFIEIRRRDGTSGLEWVYLKSDQVYLMLEKSEETINASQDSVVLYLFVDDLAAVLAFIKARGYASQPIQQTPYGIIESELLDPQKRRIRIGQKLN